MSAQQSYPLFCVACSTNLVFIINRSEQVAAILLIKIYRFHLPPNEFHLFSQNYDTNRSDKEYTGSGSKYVPILSSSNQCQNNYFQSVLVMGVAPAWYMTCKDPIKPRFHPPRTSLKVHNLLWYFNEVKNVKFSICFIWKSLSKDKKLWSASNLPEFAPAGHIIVLPDATISNVSGLFLPSLPSSLLTTNLFWNILQLA